jgi:tripartite-type tricarboxylate transporter receptor subunit TctC
LPQLPSIAPSEFAALIESDFDKWGQVARKAGLDLQ